MAASESTAIAIFVEINRIKKYDTVVLDDKCGSIAAADFGCIRMQLRLRQDL
jgi:hypothetical protein